MAKKIIKEKAIEEALWESANKLRGSVEPSEYKHVVLSLIFLKYAHDRFTERRNELMAEGKEAFADNPVFYNAKNVFYRLYRYCPWIAHTKTVSQIPSCNGTLFKIIV